MSRAELRAQRSRRRRRVAGAVVLGTVVVLAGVAVARSRGSQRSGAALSTARSARLGTPVTSSAAPLPVPSETASSAPVPMTPPESVAGGPPFPVEVARATVVDPSRPTAARGSTPASSSRTLPVTVYVPEGAGPFPLVVFAHGYDIAAADYADLLRDLAAQGFVVAAPDFPRSSRAFPGPPSQDDIDEQARDVAFVIGAFTDGGTPGPWQGRIAAGEAGVVGHSDGGNTVARAASNSCCFAARVGAAAVLAGDEGATGGTWGVAGAPPMLFVQGTADTVNPWSFSQRLYDDAAAPKTLVAIDGAGHLEPFTTGAPRAAVVALVAAFLRGHLTKDTVALAGVAALANRDGLRVAASS